MILEAVQTDIMCFAVPNRRLCIGLTTQNRMTS